MKSLDIQSVVQYVAENIGSFHQQRLVRLETLKLKDILKKKNPYLFKAKNCLTPETIVRSCADAFVSSNEETIFGDWLEGLAIFINKQVYGGWKSGILGIDLEFDKDSTRYIVTIKSGPNWANSSQVRKMLDCFSTAKKILHTSRSKITVVAVNGCCYGRDDTPYKKADYYKYCGQRFWEFISGNPELYLDIIEPLGYRAKEKNDTFWELYSAKITCFTRIFDKDFTLKDGRIDWKKLVKFNSGIPTSRDS
ncbi:MAG: PmeII family type II restriction endonuclease [Planctomycetia bacterium]|nr:PmeII family type II restriction endonuclease [Planctomycetia bacterium]